MYDTFQEQDVNLAINTFRGLDRFTPKENLEKGVADICTNFRFDEQGHLFRRPSYNKYNTTSLGANPINYLERIYIGSNKYLVGVYDTTMKVGNDSAGTFTNIVTGLTAGLQYKGLTYKNYHYFTNGTDKIQKINGLSANSTIMGCSAMVTAPTIAISAGGTQLSATSDYKYKFSWEFDGYQQANAAGFVSAATLSASRYVRLNGFETYPTNATHMRVYRTEADGALYYYHSRHTVGTVSGWALSADAYVDNTPDSSLDTTIAAPDDNGLPPVASYMALHKERVFLAGDSNFPSRVYYSQITGIVSYPDIFPANNYIDVAPDDGDVITGLGIDPTGYLCVFKKNSIRKIFTDGDPSLWEVSEPFARDGCWSPYTLKDTAYGIIYLSKDTWRYFDGQQSVILGKNPRVNNIVKNEISLNRFNKAVGFYHDNKCYLSYTNKETDSGYNDRVLIYDILNDNFIIDEKNIASFCSFNGDLDWNELCYGDSLNGFVYQEQLSTGSIVYSKLSDFRPNGTLSNLFVWNTETEPYLELGGHYTFDRMNGSCFNDYNASATLSAFDMFPTNYAVSGTYTSPALQLNANRLRYLYWNELLGDYGNITVALRTSTTSAGLSGSYGTEYSNPAGSDISGETGEAWLQFRILMSSTSLSATPRMYVKGGYALKLDYEVQKAEAETTIPAEWRSGYMQLSPEKTNCRLRRFEIDHEGATGQLSCIWDTDYENVTGIFCVNLEDNPKNYYKSFPTTAFGKKVRLNLKYTNINDLVIKAVNILYSPQPERY